MTDALPADAAAILTTWFGSATVETPVDPALQKRWFVADAAFDREIAERFGRLVEDAAAGRLAAWEEQPRGALALLLLLDQFTRNIHRESGRAFDADPTARAVADRAIARGSDGAVPWVARGFFYLPFEHSESIADQDRSVALFQALAAGAPTGLEKDATMLAQYAEKHRAVVARFGRFPHRNKVLGRESTAEEAEFLKSGRGF